MNILLNANTITENITHYENMSKLLMVLAIVFAVLTIVLGFVFKIARSIRVLSGVGIGKEIRKISEDTESGKGYAKKNTKATITWNTSDMVSNKSESQETVLLENEDEGTSVLEDEATSVLQDEATSVLSDGEATTVLQDEPTSVLGDEPTSVLGDEPTSVLQDEVTSVLSSDETQILGADAATTVLSDGETTILGGNPTDLITNLVNPPVRKQPNNADFEIEEEIIITGNQPKGN